MPKLATHTKKRLYRIITIAALAFGAIIALILFAVVAILIFVKPAGGSFEPVVWRPGSGFAVDPAKVDNKTARSIRPFTSEEFKGPEDVAVDKDGNVYTAVADGNIRRIRVGQSTSEVFANVGGRPFGLAFDKNGHLIVANSGVGLQSVAPDGKVALLTDMAGDRPIHSANDLDIAYNGIIYFSDSNSKYNLATLGDSPSFSIYDFLEGVPRGRLLQYDPATKATKELLNDLYFPNGVILADDQQSVLIAESTRYRITRYWLAGDKAGTSEIFLDDIPGVLGGIARTANGHLLLPMYDRSPTLDNRILPNSWARELLVRIPWLASAGGPQAGSVLVISEDGTVLKQIKNMQPGSSNILPYGDEWLIASHDNGKIRIIPN